MNNRQSFHILQRYSAQVLENIAILHLWTGWVSKYYRFIVLADSKPSRASFPNIYSFVTVSRVYHSFIDFFMKLG